MAKSRTVWRLAFIGVPIALLVVLAAIWDWDWFLPIVQSKASAALGRQVTIGHLHVRLRRHIEVVADDVVVGNPPGWPGGNPPFVSIGSLTIQAELLPYLEGRGLILPLIGIDKPRVYAAETRDGAANFRLSTGGGGGGPALKIGDLRIDDGDARVVMPRLKTDFDARVATQGQGQDAKIVADAKGTYAAQPITARLIGGALLSLRDHDNPWPIDLDLANGPTKVALNGTLEDPLAFKGANVRLRFSGPDMGLLEPLVGFPIPKTPAYQIAGKLNLEGLQNIRFDDLQGRLGNSDIAGSILERPSGTEVNGKDRPEVTMNLRSNRIDLTDLNGFIGGAPGRATTANATPQERETAAKARASDKLLPDTPISVPRLSWADIHLKYRGAHIEGRDMPLDDLTVALDVVNGRISVHPVSFGVGKGRLLSNIDLAPTSGKTLHARADVRMQNLDVSRMMQATHTFQGAGSISGVGAIDSTGDSLATLVGDGNGEIKMAMAGGNLSSVLIDLTGLEFGKALLSALGFPEKTPVQCFVGDLGLKRGLLDFNVMTLDTGEAIVNVNGDVNLSKETIDLALKTNSKHFSIGSLPTNIDIGGTFKDPSIRPGAEVAARVGAAAGLAALFAPLAILPTIQFGTSDADDARCGELLQQARASAGGKALPTERPAASAQR
nr:AsmA family protein [uncultured Rhodopila sp.]